MLSSILSLLLIVGTTQVASAFTVLPNSARSSVASASWTVQAQVDENDDLSVSSRRSFFETGLLSTAAIMTAITTTTTAPALAADEEQKTEERTVLTPLYYILRVKEASEQETRLIKSGKFKDLQRANVKLAVRFMLVNYRLNDNFIAASAFLTGDRKIKAADIGQSVVQNLNTILEYFDSSDVENIKVSQLGLGGKETIVLNGLASTKRGIDDFVSLFPKEDVAAVVAKIEAENELNAREFDTELGAILNLKPTTTP